MIGKTLGHYQITEKLGEGGMGVVYLANDLSLGRKVALKFLSQELQQDAIAHKRLLREAKAAAVLDHPNICSIHEVSQAEGQDFIVMEYVEGQNLRDRLHAGPLPLNEALQIASEVAEALEEAHERGIIHRDLKPANIMLTKKGHAKVMDFGLAKHVMPEGGIESQEQTITAMTQGGTTVGTLAYMSPEQLRGGSADARSDIFSFGVVLHEMLTGVHPFKKGTGMDTASAILNVTPRPLADYLPYAPILLQHTVRRMLAKDLARRYQQVHEIGTDLQDMLAEIASQAGGASPSPAAIAESRAVQPLALGRHRFNWIHLTIVAILAAGITSVAVWRLKKPPSMLPGPHLRTIVSVRPAKRLSSGHGPNEVARKLDRPARPSFVVSPDSRYLVYSGMSDNGNEQLFIWALDEMEASPIPGTEGGACPFLSPDGQWIGYSTSKLLMRIALNGGPPMWICELPEQVLGGWPHGATWGPSNTIIFAGETKGLFRVTAAGGRAERLTTPDPAEYGHRLPYITPDGEAVIFTVARHYVNSEQSEIVM